MGSNEINLNTFTVHFDGIQTECNTLCEVMHNNPEQANSKNVQDRVKD